jgi:hypothetical protein
VFRSADFLIAHFHLLKAHFVRILRETVLDANLSSPVSNQLSLNVLRLFYETVDRIALRALSPQFLRDTITVLNFLIFVPVVDRSAVLLDVHRLYEVLARIVVAHGRLFANLLTKFASYGDAVGCAIVGSLVKIGLPIVGRLVKITLDSALPSVFQIALNMCVLAVDVPGFALTLSDLFLDICVRDEGPTVRNRCLVSYFRAVAELAGQSSLFVNEFVRTVGFPKIVDVVDEFCDDFRGNSPDGKLVLLDAVLFFSERLYQRADGPLPPLHLDVFFGLANQFPVDSVESLVNLAHAVGRKNGAFPYVVNWAKLESHGPELAARLRSGIDNLAADAHAGDEDQDEETPLLPWTRAVVRVRGSAAALPVVVRRPERIDRKSVV